MEVRFCRPIADRGEAQDIPSGWNGRYMKMPACIGDGLVTSADDLYGNVRQCLPAATVQNSTVNLPAGYCTGGHKEEDRDEDRQLHLRYCAIILQTRPNWTPVRIKIHRE